jgi:hypothetical protein
MEFLSFVVVAALGAGFAHWLNRHERETADRQRRIDEVSGQQPRPEGAGGGSRDAAGPLQVDFVRGLATCHVGCDLTLRRKDLETDILKQRGVKEIELGDAAFDREFYLQGPPALVRAIFDAETRRFVRRLPHVEIVAGVLRASIRDVGATEKGEPTTETLAKFAERLACPGDLAQSLAENVRSDPEPRVRLETS